MNTSKRNNEPKEIKMRTQDRKEIKKRANKYYQSPTSNNLDNLILFYDTLNEDDAQEADSIIRKLIPSWGH